MITPEKFIDKWNVVQNGCLVKFNNIEVMDADFSDDVKRFLSIAGLPETPPPYLEFIDPKFRPITNVFDMPDQFQKYWLLGTTGMGDPICITEKVENIVMLHTGDNHREVFVNSSLNQFAESLLVYVCMIEKSIGINGADAFVENNIPESVICWLKEELERIDSKSMESGSFWSNEFEDLIE